MDSPVLHVGGGTYTRLYAVVPSRLCALSHIGFCSFCHDAILLCSYALSFIHIPAVRSRSDSYTPRLCLHALYRIPFVGSYSAPQAIHTHGRTPVVHSDDPGASVQMNEPLAFICKPSGPSSRHSVCHTNSRSCKCMCLCACNVMGKVAKGRA